MRLRPEWEKTDQWRIHVQISERRFKFPLATENAGTKSNWNTKFSSVFLMDRCWHDMKALAIIKCLGMDEQWGDGSANKLKWAWNCQLSWKSGSLGKQPGGRFGLHLFRPDFTQQYQRWGHVQELWQGDLTGVRSIKRLAFLNMASKALSNKRWVSLVEKQACCHDLKGVFVQAKLGQAKLMISNTFKKKKKNSTKFFCKYFENYLGTKKKPKLVKQ